MGKQSKRAPVDLGATDDGIAYLLEPPPPIRGPVIVDSRTSYDYFANAREDIRDYLDKVAAVYDPIQQRQKADRVNTLAERRTHEADALSLDTEIKRAISDYSTEQRANKLAIENKMQQTVEKAQRDAIAELAAHIARSGDPDAALDLLQSDVNTPIPKLHHTTAGSTTVPDYVIVDESQIKPAYLTTPQPDKMKIRAAVRAHRKDAEGIVGGIEYVEKVVPRRQSRRKDRP